MIKKEWQAILKNKFFIVIIVALATIPALYNLIFLSSMWDPYGKTGELPVAVVNMDKSVDYEGKTLDVGDQLVENLKKNELLDWHFVSQKQAEQGMKDKKYYMVVTLPENFSKNASTLLDKNPKKMNITYETNGSLNYIGEVIGETAAKQLQSEVSANVTKAYAESIFAQIEKVGDGFTQAADGSKKLQEGSTKLNDGNKTITENLQKLATSTITFSDGANKLEVGLDQYTDGVTQLNDGATKLNDGIGQLASNVGPLQAGVGQLSDGSSKLSNGLNDLNNGQNDLDNGLTQLLAGSQTLQAGLTQLDNAITATDVNQPMVKLKAGLNKMKAGMEKLNNQVNGPELTAEIAQIAQLETQLGVVIQNLQGLGGTISPQNPENNAAKVISTINASPSITDDEKAKLIAEVQPVLVAQAQEQGTYIQAIKTALESLSPAGEPSIRQQVGALQTGVQELYNGFNGQVGLYNGTNQALDTIHMALNNPNATAENPSLILGATSLSQGLEGAKNGSSKLVGGVSQLSQGATALNGGIGQISGKLPELISGVTQLNDGSSQLAAGTGKLTENSPQLKDGIGQLASGATQIQSGSGQLADGSKTLGDGLGTLNSGTKELSTKLGDGAKEVNGIKATDKTFDMLASPDKLTHKEFSHVDNYGAALAPYVMSLALYVGSLVFNFIFPIRKISMEGQSSRAWWLSKFSIGTVVAIAMAVIEVGIMLVLGLNVQSVGQMFTMAIVTSLAYMFIIMFLAMTFDNPGRFVAMVLLIVQLGGAGGSFPMPLTNGFFNAIHPFLPMSHSIYGFREAISGGLGQGTSNQSVFILVAIFVVFSGLLMVSMNWLQKRHLDDVSQLDNNQKLQAVEE